MKKDNSYVIALIFTLLAGIATLLFAIYQFYCGPAKDMEGNRLMICIGAAMVIVAGILIRHDIKKSKVGKLFVD